MLFYPSHDIALSNGVRHFNPPQMAIRLQEDLAHLSDIWNRDYLEGRTPMPIPWGWDYDTRLHLHREYKVKMTQLPTDEQLLHIRQLSSRQTTIRLLDEILQAVPGLRSTCPVWLDTEDAVFEYIRQHDEAGRAFVFKTPWSSSGRGLALSQNRGKDGAWHPVARETLLTHARGTLRRMGGLMAEEWLDDKVQDFAMLFEARGSRVHWIGYSLFDNDPATQGTTYRRGYLLSNDRIESLLTTDAGLQLRPIAVAYEDILTRLLEPLLGQAWPLGYLGIDMMTTTQGIVPCVELNLRCTMGSVCRLWYDQHHEEGTFCVSPMQADGHFVAEFRTGADALR